MTTEEKAKAYDEALKNANEWLKSSDIQDEAKCVIEDIFHELNESEDERIRKAIEEAVCHYWNDDTQAKTDCLAWLEKQKEQKPADEDRPGMLIALRSEYEKGRADAIAEMGREWSEEDEKMLKRVIESIRISRSSCEEDDDIKDMYDEELNWLESLHPQQRKES